MLDLAITGGTCVLPSGTQAADIGVKDGRIVLVGGPGTLPFDYFVGREGAQAWLPVPEAARAAFPAVATVVARGVVHRR